MLRNTVKSTATSAAARHFSSTSRKGMKVLCVLYPDPVDGFPPHYLRESVPDISKYPDGQTAPNPKAIDFTPGHLLGSVSGELGLRKFLEANGHELVVTSDKEGPNSVFEQELPTADVVISQPFWPAYLDADRISRAKNLKLALTAGIGSDHVDLDAANKAGITVAEVTYSNSNSVAEHTVMMILGLVRNYIPSHKWATEKRGWNIADCVAQSYDVEGMDVGVIAAGRIGLRVLRLMKPFDVNLHYYDSRRLPAEVEKELNLTYHDSPQDLARSVDVLSLHCPLHPKTHNMVNAELLSQMRKGAYIINTARGALCVRDDIAKSLEDGHLGGYAGDVWYPQPPPADHPWRTMPRNGMTPHISGTSLSAQARYAAGTREILENFFNNDPIRDVYLIAQGGQLAGVGAKSYTVEKGKASPGSHKA
ncbi:Formate dehydrogenase [Wickerhamiella sorbophila]|uniref:Formate dehydrogenase n=1 Tax=Wickerhamiella sorbophila TaxID=45607 RepID=A0A2T0FK27_9ASCO|nr:Formate dehydrogenase [Wickerhamiella sorbophila]PRT55325.1 Formate dehydrogenase [Wickerhamiella sorbophila]